ncbi:MAG: secretion protein HlyD [Pirellulaceae bacterium]|nr:MAG: secretion protein HlyD [Pirellulaceae bacterium]
MKTHPCPTTCCPTAGAGHAAKPKLITGTTPLVLHDYFALVGILVLGILATLGCRSHSAGAEEGTWQTARGSEIIVVEAVPVQAQPVERTVHFVGTLDAWETIDITPKVQGKVLAIHADVGDRVLPGALLLELDPVDYRLAVEEAQRALEAELARLGLREPPESSFDIDQLPAVQRAEAVRENSWRKYLREKELLERNAGSAQAFEQAETDWKVADAQLRQARLEAEAILAQVRHRQAALAVARQRLTDTQLFAPTAPDSTPSSGSPPYDFIVSERFVSAGEMVGAFPSAPAFTLVRDDILKLRVLVPERYLSQVRQNLEVFVTCDAYPGEKFPAQVARIYPTIDPANRTFQVECHVPNPDRRLKPGAFARAEVVLERNERALVVPREAVVRFAGVTKLFVIENEQARAVEVEIGTEGRDWVEVKGNLRAGALVAIDGQSRLVDGSRVKLRAPPADDGASASEE